MQNISLPYRGVGNLESPACSSGCKREWYCRIATRNIEQYSTQLDWSVFTGGCRSQLFVQALSAATPDFEDSAQKHSSQPYLTKSGRYNLIESQTVHTLTFMTKIAFPLLQRAQLSSSDTHDFRNESINTRSYVKIQFHIQYSVVSLRFNELE